jgi:RecJ-like exonuclease
MKLDTIKAITKQIKETLELKKFSGDEFTEVLCCLLEIKNALNQKEGPNMDDFNSELKKLKGLKTEIYDFADSIEKEMADN